MFLIIFSIILTIILILGLGYSYTEEEWSLKPRMLLGLLGLLIILFGCFTNIGANTVGIMYNPFKNGVQNEILGEGFKGKSPFDKVYKISTEVEDFTFENISVQTNDGQYVNTILQVQARIDKENAFEFFKKYGGKKLKDIQNILSNTVQKQLEKITTQYNIIEVLGEKRDEIVNKTLEEVKSELNKDGILIERIVLVDTDAGETIENAIANEAVAKKEAETAKYLKEKAQLEGEAKVIEAQKEKEANDLKETSLTKEILTEKMLEKWNGILPTTYAGKDIMSIFNINQ